MVRMAPSRLRSAAGVGYSVVAYTAFLLSTGWAAAFLADRRLPRGVDHGARHPAVVAIAVDLGLLLVFAVQHTVMARAGFKAWLGRRVPPALERSTYVLASSTALALLFAGWQPLGGEVWDVHGVAAGVLWGVFGLGWTVAISSTFMIDHWDFLGLGRAYRHARGEPPTAPAFRERWLFAWVRHPLMLGLLVTFWATPRLSGGHLLFAVAASAYVAVGVRFEERDLRRELGEVYADYVERVPAIVPTRRPRPRVPA
jgi:protein-S-isoprenylcysteine O-methyltransferase Ste14